MTTRRLRVACGGLLTACALLLLILPATAAAHAVLVGADPPAGASVRTAPGALRLTFDEDVVPQLARVSVTSPQGEQLADAPRVSGSIVTVPVRSGGRGSYTVRWRMVASNDGHATEGAFAFGVDAKALAPTAASGVGVPAAPEFLAWLQFLGVVLAGGVLTFRAVVLVPATRSVASRDVPDARMAMWVAATGAAVALHAGVLAFLLGAHSIVGGSLWNLVDAQIEPITSGTHLGQAWTFMSFAWLGVLGLIVAAWVTPPRREQLLACAGVATLAIAFGISWASHPASRGTAALLADYVHLAAAALWVGALVALVVAAGMARALPSNEREAVSRACIVRFSQLAVVVVAVVTLAGVFLALRELPSLSSAFSSRYGVTLLAKSALVFPALALGAYHRRFVVPRLARGAPVAAIRNTLALELGLLVIALVLAATLSQTAPPH